MKIMDFVKAFVPSLERGEVRDELERLRTELDESTQPVFITARQQFENTGFAHKDNQAFNVLFCRSLRNVRSTPSNWIVACNDVYTNLGQVLSYIDNQFDKAFGRDITAQGMTYLRANIIQYLDIASFALRYGRRMLHYTVAREFEQASGDKQTPLVPAELRWLENQQRNFFQAMSILAIAVKDAEKYFTNIPDAIAAPEGIDAMVSNVGINKVDPFQMNLINARLNPIYYIGMSIAEWQAKRYNLAREEKKALEYRLQSLRELQEEGLRDTRMEREIEYTEDRVNKLTAKINKLEEGN